MEAEAPNAEALSVWEAWVAKKLPGLAWQAAGGYDGAHLAEACPQAFTPPAAAGTGGKGGKRGKRGSGGGGGDGGAGAHKALFFIGTEPREVSMGSPRSSQSQALLLTGGTAVDGLPCCASPRPQDPASLYDGSSSNLPPEFLQQGRALSAGDATRLQASLEQVASRWAERPEGCACRVSLLAPAALPGWVLEQAEQEGGEPDD